MFPCIYSNKFSHVSKRYIVSHQCCLQLLPYCWSSFPHWYILFAHCFLFELELLCHMHICTKDCVTFFVQQFVIAIKKTYQHIIYLARYYITLYLIYISCILLYIFHFHSPSKHTFFYSQAHVPCTFRSQS